MSGSERRQGTPIDPPWSVDLLADLHAGVLDTETEALLRPRVEADPEARAVLEALDATLADLSSLPPIPMPRDVAERIDLALAAEARGVPAPVVSLNSARQRKNRRLGWGASALVAAAAAVGVFAVVIPNVTNNTENAASTFTQPSKPNASAPADARPDLIVTGENFGPVFGDVLKAQNYGPLDNQDTLDGCLKGGNIPASKPLGVSPIQLDAKPAVMAILGGGRIGSYRIVVLDPSTCGPDNPSGVLANTVMAP
ncbi:hypothetical protein ACFFQW_43405 [Umezawaea endophytica]|uniref:Anti-sigma-M factor RsmA n=1 Tax=Umezawaea endophytica TaxID=1654476 RepID=A0A9X2VWY5_9PSEU|nr:hypothetical protein [Umezawaea endophytica]MCS7483609.1 hypothetical protein [Umezawaea endophytica]